MSSRRWSLALAGVVLISVVAIGVVAIAASRRAHAPTGAASVPEAPMVTLQGPPTERPAAPAGAPNVVLVMGCTVRRDQTSLFGAPPEVTPFLSSVAAAGARLDDLVTAAPWTRAASTAVLTGHHPVAIGMAEPGRGRDERVLPDRVVTLAEHLRDHGWRTLGLTTNPNLNAVYGFDQGFDVYRQPALLWRDSNRRIDGVPAVDDALALLDALPGDPGAPFYLQIMLIDAHAPFTANAREQALFSAPGLPDQVVRYRASLRRLDDAVAYLARGLAARGHPVATGEAPAATDTVFAFVNDHGDGLGWPDHHGASHGRYLAPSAVGGVFVASGPGIAPATHLSGLSSQVDLAPTLAGLVGAAPFPSPGLDLSPGLRGGDAPQRDRAFTDTWFKDVDRAAVYTPGEACQLDLAPHPRADPRWADGCFERLADPLHEHAYRDEPLEEDLRAWRRERLAEAEAFGPVERAEPDAATRSQLEALGYSE
ncbi:MAG: sulfatase-like hydrolase/transferase [Myxococcota bacterium]